MRRQKRNSVRIVGALVSSSTARRGTLRPRLAIKRSNTTTYAQLIDDAKGTTLLSVSSREIKDAKKTKTEAARMAGELLAKRASLKGIKEVVFDRRGYKYHGRVKAFADGARTGGLTF